MKKTVAIIMGGYSSEHDISIKSGEIVYEYIDRELYIPYKVHIQKDSWALVNDQGQRFEIDKNDFSALIEGQKINFDLVFNAIHGAPGENGQFLAYLELLGISHSSAPFYQMALTFNKRDCLSVAQKYGISTAKSIYLNQGDSIDPVYIEKELGFPLFVKPNNAGSSYGISKVYNTNELLQGIEKAYIEDQEIILESFLEGTEVSVGVISLPEGPMVLPMTEIVSENDFFDYEAKYEGKSQEITPARISKEMKEIIENKAVHLYNKFGMKGFSRSEFIIVEDEPYFLEMNTVPGLTLQSILPQQAAKAGINLRDLIHSALIQSQS
ncbi:MAG: D-alanine--D-alanine ligase [Flavobacteriaceae bacterium]